MILHNMCIDARVELDDNDITDDDTDNSEEDIDNDAYPEGHDGWQVRQNIIQNRFAN